eukprot:2288921-Pyramimonas_sp.AAC.2
MSQLDYFMQDQKLPKEMQKEISMYVMRLKQSMDMKTYQHYLNLMSPGLRGKLLVYTNRSWLGKVSYTRVQHGRLSLGKPLRHWRIQPPPQMCMDVEKVPHFQNTPHDFQIEVASILNRQLYVPNEVLIRYGSVADDMYIVLKGIAAGKNRLFT